MVELWFVFHEFDTGFDCLQDLLPLMSQGQCHRDMHTRRVLECSKVVVVLRLENFNQSNRINGIESIFLNDRDDTRVISSCKVNLGYFSQDAFLQV